MLRKETANRNTCGKCYYICGQLLLCLWPLLQLSSTVITFVVIITFVVRRLLHLWLLQLLTIFARHILLACSLASFAIFARPTLPWVGRRVLWWFGKYSTESFSVTVPGWVVAPSGLHGYLFPCCASPSSTNPELKAPAPKLIS